MSSDKQELFTWARPAWCKTTHAVSTGLGLGTKGIAVCGKQASPRARCQWYRDTGRYPRCKKCQQYLLRTARNLMPKHQWRGPKGPIRWKHCASCGVIKRLYGRNTPYCKGPAKTGPRKNAAPT